MTFVLNPEQLEAVTYPSGHLLVLAGAGSGKTRVLTHRIAWLLEKGTRLEEIFAVTFTNRAANEMRERLEKILHVNLRSMWIGTFHGVANQFLRRHYEVANLDHNFQIMDSEDQVRLLKQIHRSLGLDNDRWSPKQSQHYINQQKELGIRAAFVDIHTAQEEVLQKIYSSYEKTCISGNLVDFTELLLKTFEILTQDSNLQKFYREKFTHVLVDEFQDTNDMQYRFIRNLATQNLTAVGDDDQAIYGWRGADSNNLKRLTEDYPRLKIIRLEQNYRSTKNILMAANAVINYNQHRLGKKLWTQAEEGELLTIYPAINEIDESNFIVTTVKKLLNSGIKLREIAILYRSNAQSRILEEQFLRHQINYHIYGGRRFFERSEIKDVLAYLRLIVNHKDDVAFERVINLPNRGLGETFLNQIRANRADLSLWQTMESMAPKRNGFLNFKNILQDLTQQAGLLNLPDLITYLITQIGLLEYYSKHQPIDNLQTRKENLDELITAAQQFSQIQEEKNPIIILTNFLAAISLESENKESNDQDFLNLMTLHAAKGLEFPIVFITGMEEGLFPHAMSIREGTLEEERRLCYVGITRAKEKLYLITANNRQIRGITGVNRVSRFLEEIPKHLVENNFPTIQETLANNLVTDWLPQQKVRHLHFGEGTIISVEGSGEFSLLRIRFLQYGDKLLSPKYAKLEKL